MYGNQLLLAMGEYASAPRRCPTLQCAGRYREAVLGLTDAYMLWGQPLNEGGMHMHSMHVAAVRYTRGSQAVWHVVHCVFGTRKRYVQATTNEVTRTMLCSLYECRIL